MWQTLDKLLEDSKLVEPLKFKIRSKNFYFNSIEAETASWKWVYEHMIIQLSLVNFSRLMFILTSNYEMFLLERPPNNIAEAVFLMKVAPSRAYMEAIKALLNLWQVQDQEVSIYFNSSYKKEDYYSASLENDIAIVDFEGRNGVS